MPVQTVHAWVGPRTTVCGITGYATSTLVKFTSMKINCEKCLEVLKFLGYSDDTHNIQPSELGLYKETLSSLESLEQDLMDSIIEFEEEPETFGDIEAAEDAEIATENTYVDINTAFPESLQNDENEVAPEVEEKVEDEEAEIAEVETEEVETETPAEEPAKEVVEEKKPVVKTPQKNNNKPKKKKK